jgi:hypothetical protein
VRNGDPWVFEEYAIITKYVWAYDQEIRERAVEIAQARAIEARKHWGRLAGVIPS